MYARDLKIEMDDQDYLNLDWFAEKILDNQGICELIKEGRKNIPENFWILLAINEQYLYNNTTFFITFTNKKKEKPSHQIEFEKIMQEAYNTYNQ